MCRSGRALTCVQQMFAYALEVVMVKILQVVGIFQNEASSLHTRHLERFWRRWPLYAIVLCPWSHDGTAGRVPLTVVDLKAARCANCETKSRLKQGSGNIHAGWTLNWLVIEDCRAWWDRFLNWISLNLWVGLSKSQALLSPVSWQNRVP